jgi:hypothetical protein
MPSDQDRVAAGVAPGNKLAPQRDAQGRLLKGHTANPHGRPKGSMNNTTRLAARRAQASADKTVQRLEELAESDDPYLALQAIRLLLELALRSPEDNKEPATEWMSEKELRVFMRLLQRATRKRDAGEPKAPRGGQPDEQFRGIPAPASEAVIDVAPEPETIRIPIPQRPEEA